MKWSKTISKKKIKRPIREILFKKDLSGSS
nr:MAG TPA: hypothetical protein [Myoviridae sp. ctfuG5]